MFPADNWLMQQLHSAVELSVVMEMFYIYSVIEHLKCGLCDCGTEFFILFNFNYF